MAYITPNLWTPFVQEGLKKTQNLISMGLVEVDTNSPVSESGQYLNLAYQQPLSLIKSVQRITTSTTLTPTANNDMQEIGVVCHVGDAYYEPAVATLERGFDGIAAIGSQISEVALLGIQDYLVSVAKGQFATGGVLATTHTHNPAGGALTVDAIVDGVEEVYDENLDSVTSILMHSAKFAGFLKDNLVTYVDAADFGADILYTGKIPTILGKRVLLNNTLCASFVDGGATKYPTYLTMGQPWYLGYQQTLRVKTDEDILTGGGKNIIAWYADFLPHIKGVSYTSGGANPTTGTLETIGNWTKKAQDYNIGIMRINTL
jgi:hypothetical protein